MYSKSTSVTSCPSPRWMMLKCLGRRRRGGGGWREGWGGDRETVFAQRKFNTVPRPSLTSPASSLHFFPLLLFVLFFFILFCFFTDSQTNLNFQKKGRHSCKWRSAKIIKKKNNQLGNVLTVIYGRWKWRVRNVGWSEQEAPGRINLRRRSSPSPRV